MWFPLILLSFSAFSASSFGFSFQSFKQQCPPAEEVKPCTCTDYGDVTALCKDIDETAALLNVFTKNPDWNLERIHFDNCNMHYIPATVIQYRNLKQLNVSSSRMSSVFEKAPENTPEFDLFLNNVTLSRGMEWELFEKSSISGLGTFDVEIRHFGKDFLEYMPEGVKNLWFENSKTVRITHQAFKRMVNLDLFTLTGGSLKKITRDIWPRPWNVKFLNLNRQKIAAFPEDMFDEMPQLFIFAAIGNQIQTIDQKIFTKGMTTYFLGSNPIYCNCDVKWITTTGKQSFMRFIGKCTEPESFSGKELKKLKEEDFSFCQ